MQILISICGSEEPGYGIWAMHKTANGWSEPAFQFVCMYVTTAKNGTVYVTEEEDYIVRRKLADNKYQDSSVSWKINL